MAREQLKNLTEPMYYILLSLLKENHGYGIMQMVEELTGGRVVIGAGTLYSLLGRFEKEGIIRQVAEENRRKIYIVTEKGSALLREEYERLNHLVEDGRKFFNFEGERKDPPEDGDGGEKEVSCASKEKAEAESCTAQPSKEPTEPTAKKEKPEKKERSFAPRGSWNYGGAY